MLRRCRQRLCVATSTRVDVPIANPRRILFMGGDRVSLASLQKIHHGLTQNDKSNDGLFVLCPPVVHSRSSASMAQHHPIAHYCRENGIAHHTVSDAKALKKDDLLAPKARDVLPTLSAFDLAIVVSFRYFLPNWFLHAIPPCVNMHPSLLPRYRGASPIYHTLLRGETTAGVSIIKISPSELMDCGDILCQQELEVPPTMTVQDYESKVVEAGASLLAQTVFSGRLDRFWKDAAVQPDKRSAKDDPFGAPKVDRRHCGHLDFHSMDGFVAYNVWRAFVGHFQVFCSMNKRASPVGSRIKDPKKAHVRVIVKEALHFSQLSHETQVEFASTRLVPIWSEEHQCAVVVRHHHNHTHTHTHQCNAAHSENSAANSTRSVPPGSCCFSKTADNVMGIKCTRGWLFCSEVTLNNGVSQSVETLRTAMCFRKGVGYPGVFIAAPLTTGDA